MANKPIMGDNRTGTARAPGRCEEMVSGNLEFAPLPIIDDTPISEVRVDYATESLPLGTVPPPASVKQVGKSVAAKLKGTSPTVFVDKLGARLAFERNGVRLYQALVSKFDAYGGFEGGPVRAELVVILEQEQEHFALLRRAMEKLGADPTALTPSGDVEAVLGMGVQAVMVDPRMNFSQSLNAALIAELTDNECWEVLVQLAEGAGEEKLAVEFRTALEEENQHLVAVRGWMTAQLKAA
jgi:rubrerythrin